MPAQLRRSASALVKRLDHAAGRALGRHRVLVDVRTPMNLVVLRPVWRLLLEDPRIAVAFTAEHMESVGQSLGAEGVREALVPRHRAAWSRFDLALTADLWNPAPLRRCRRTMTFFHGVAGKYDLDAPDRIAAAGVGRYDRIAFVNEDRMARYLASGAVRPDQAVLVGFPKLDALLGGAWQASEIRTSLHLPPAVETVLYAPTFSVASSLHLAGEAIVELLLESGRNVIVKLHDRSIGVDAERTGGLDWMARLGRFERHPRFALARGADVAPLLAAADLLVTDHSTVGFEFALLDRPIVVYHAPHLKETARIADDKWTLLRSMAEVVDSPPALLDAVARARRDPGARQAARRAARALFAHPGHATAQALAAVYDLLELPPPRAIAARVTQPHGAAAHEPPLEAHG